MSRACSRPPTPRSRGSVPRPASARRPAGRRTRSTYWGSSRAGMVDRVARGCFDQPLMGRQYEDVMRELVDAIVGGEYPEGGWLPSLDELGARLGASRGVLREALRGLEERGLIAVQAGRGQLIRQREEWDTRSPDVLRACIERGPDAGVLGQVVEARAVVEREAAEHACEFAADADSGLLRSRIASMERALE